MQAPGIRVKCFPAKGRIYRENTPQIISLKSVERLVPLGIPRQTTHSQQPERIKADHPLNSKAGPGALASFDGGSSACSTLEAAPLLHRRPNAVDIIMVVKRLQKLTHLRALLFGERREILGEIAELRSHDRPTIAAEPLGHSV